VLHHPRPDVLIGDRHPVDETGALLADVEARNVLDAERTLHEHRGAREEVVG
jgi:hypothetical protein